MSTSRVIGFPKAEIRKIDSLKKKTPFRFDPLPSLIAEEWLTKLNLAEIRCIIYICRRTWGFRKEWDAISIDQFVRGVVSKDGKRLDNGVGFAETKVRSTLRELEKKRLIEVNHRSTKAHLYRVTIFRGSLICEPQVTEVS